MKINQSKSSAAGSYGSAKHAKQQFIDANKLTRLMIGYIIMLGGFASRIQSVGIYDPSIKRFRPSTSHKGLPDIIATYKGMSLFIEVKAGPDTQTEYQKKVQEDQEKAGGWYYLCRNFTHFQAWLDNLNPKNL
jgi:hypothetical protein